VIADPPSLLGARQEITDEASAPVDANTVVGAPGFVAATTTSGSAVSVTVIEPSTLAVPRLVTVGPTSSKACSALKLDPSQIHVWVQP
jgi:hypothetical protein